MKDWLSDATRTVCGGGGKSYINGILSDWFHIQQAIRQEYKLSPYLMNFWIIL